MVNIIFSKGISFRCHVHMGIKLKYNQNSIVLKPDTWTSVVVVILTLIDAHLPKYIQ